ncbi:PD-(D/E)XK nuclease family protein [Polaribacter atrinae]|uniref:PDDEXK-like family protein n=1 Tax=Polaribacter atrinae TaxID=1333662 RepID=UPI00249278FF|nr:PD-(D/E)XK nuclease family protein [Polaribacter atrinae]
MKKLLKKVKEISEKYEELNKVSGNSFNVFNVINVTSDEVRLHSKFLAELLNPKGSHGQDDVFLQLFAKQLNIDIDTVSATVEVEKYIGVKTKTSGGYLDIYVKDSKGKSFIIENKIYAPDQENQLLRYYNFDSKNLFYLNLLGDEPSGDSCGLLMIDKDFKIISYKSDIIEWLSACRKEAVELPLLREGITHYINLIKILTGQSVNSKMNTEIRDYIASSTDNLKQASLIGENMTAAKIKIQWLFWQSLKEKMIANGLDLIEDNSVTWQNVSNYYTKSRNRDLYYGFWVKIGKIEDVTIHFGVELLHNVYFGFTLEENKKGGISNLEKYTEYKNMVLDLNHNYKNSQYWLGWRHTSEKLNFNNFNSEAIFALADRKKLDQTTNKIVADILIDINALKTKLENI